MNASSTSHKSLSADYCWDQLNQAMDAVAPALMEYLSVLNSGDTLLDRDQKEKLIATTDEAGSAAATELGPDVLAWYTSTKDALNKYRKAVQHRAEWSERYRVAPNFMGHEEIHQKGR